MDKRTVCGLVIKATAGLLGLVSLVEAAPPPAGLNNPFPPSFYGFNPGYYGPYYPGHYQYGGVQPSTYNNYRSPTFSGYGTSSNVPLFYSSRPYGSPSTLGSTSSGFGSSITSPAYAIPRSNPSAGALEARRTPVLIEVHVPAPNAEVWVEGWKTASRGDWRQFLSPPLVPGERYAYDVRAQWFQNGREVNQIRKVPVRAGEQIVVDFTAPEPAQAKSVP
jgi:uncharacterized protein (TIGR03000 family)